jgi:hypothetical protein
MLLRSLLGSLSATQLEWLLRSLAILVGSWFSPSWALFRETITPWIDIDQVAQSETMLFEILDFYARLQAHRDLVVHTLLPKLALCLFVSLGFLYLCNKTGQWMARYLIQKHLTRPAHL